MKKNLLIFCVEIFSAITLQAQSYPVQNYEELTDNAPVNQALWKKQQDGLLFAWGTTDVRYPKTNVPEETTSRRTCTLSGWKGEKLNAQFVLWSRQEQPDITIQCTDLKDKKGNTISSKHLSTGFVRYVMTDELNKERTSGCGLRPDKTEWDSLLVADPIDINPVFSLKARNTCPVWVSVKIPQDVPAGTYQGSILIMRNNEKAGALNLEVKVGTRTLPEPQNWRFHLDLWQNPFAVSRYYGTGLWTEAHFEAMRPIMKSLADAGQKVITTSIMHKPWNGQTYDYFESMITWIKKYDGSWEFKFDVFDAWVEFMMSLGIDKQINCYSMVPWSLSFQYFDQKTNRMQTLHSKPGEKEYTEVWTALLKSFSRHLKEKGWFEKTCIAMDERPLPAMKQVIELIHHADKDFKLSLAGLYYEEIEPYIHDYCISTDQLFPWKAIERRKAENKVTTYYTYCADTRPNTFTFSNPAEATWIGFYAARLHMDGYLRWAYNSWVEHPLQDSRFITWAGGDTYLIYPGPRTSIRFERLIEGIQQCEKIFLLKEEYAKHQDTGAIKKLDKKLESFDLEDLKKGGSAEEAVRQMTQYINKL